MWGGGGGGILDPSISLPEYAPVDESDWGFVNLSASQHQSQVSLQYHPPPESRIKEMMVNLRNLIVKKILLVSVLRNV